MAHSSAGLGDRKAMQRFLASMVVRALPRVFTGIGEQHSYLDGLLLHRAVPSSWGTNRAQHTMDRSAHRFACRHFFGFLHSSGKRQRDAQEGSSQPNTKKLTLHKPAIRVAHCPHKRLRNLVGHPEEDPSRTGVRLSGSALPPKAIFRLSGCGLSSRAKAFPGM